MTELYVRPNMAFSFDARIRANVMSVKRQNTKQFNFRGPVDLIDKFKKICESRGEYTGPTLVALVRLYVNRNGEYSEQLETRGQQRRPAPPLAS